MWQAEDGLVVFDDEDPMVWRHDNDGDNGPGAVGEPRSYISFNKWWNTGLLQMLS